MKRILLAGAAIATLSAAAWAVDGGKQETRVRVNSDHHVVLGGDGPIVELRGANGERTLHMERDGSETVITVDGQTIEIRDGEVRVDGQVVEAGHGHVVIVDGDEVRVVGAGSEVEFDRAFALHMAERAEHMARLHEHLENGFAFGNGEDFVLEFDAEGLQADVLASLEETLSGLEGGDYRGRDWDELSDEEREEVRETLREAREEVREAMAEVREEMREMEREMEGERRRIRVELRNAAREMERAEREVERAAREHRRVEIIRRLHGDEADGDRAMIWHHRNDGEGIAERRDVRIEEDDDGRRRVWIDGEEQTGDDLTRWLNRLETDRLAGASGDNGARRHRRVERLELDGDNGHRVIELDGGRRVVILERGGDEDGED
jgi:hypothetical protein